MYTKCIFMDSWLFTPVARVRSLIFWHTFNTRYRGSDYVTVVFKRFTKLCINRRMFISKLKHRAMHSLFPKFIERFILCHSKPVLPITDLTWKYNIICQLGEPCCFIANGDFTRRDNIKRPYQLLGICQTPDVKFLDVPHTNCRLVPHTNCRLACKCFAIAMDRKNRHGRATGTILLVFFVASSSQWLI